MSKFDSLQETIDSLSQQVKIMSVNHGSFQPQYIQAWLETFQNDVTHFRIIEAREKFAADDSLGVTERCERELAEKKADELKQRALTRQAATLEALAEDDERLTPSEKRFDKLLTTMTSCLLGRNLSGDQAEILVRKLADLIAMATVANPDQFKVHIIRHHKTKPDESAWQEVEHQAKMDRAEKANDKLGERIDELLTRVPDSRFLKAIAEDHHKALLASSPSGFVKALGDELDATFGDLDIERAGGASARPRPICSYCGHNWHAGACVNVAPEAAAEAFVGEVITATDEAFQAAKKECTERYGGAMKKLAAYDVARPALGTSVVFRVDDNATPQTAFVVDVDTDDAEAVNHYVNLFCINYQGTPFPFLSVPHKSSPNRPGLSSYWDYQ